MGTSINQNIKAGNSVYHIQTEYYKASGKIVTNIFKNGMTVKRLEKEVSEEEGIDIDEEIKAFHRSIVDKLTGKTSKVKKESKHLTLSEEEVDKILSVIFPFFGIASQLAVKDALETSQTVEEFIRNIVSDLPEDIKKEVTERLKDILDSRQQVEGTATLANNIPKGEKISQDKSVRDVGDIDTDKILTILSDYFGIASYLVLEDAIETWKEKGGGYDVLVEIIVSELEDKEMQDELRQRLLFV
jgi:hypothetical protein